MHKKDIVKDVIDKYIKKGKDFYELTPSYLVQLDELKGFSERTLKRGRTEYKAAHKGVIETHSKNKASERRKIYKFLDQHPESLPKAIEKAFPELDKKTITASRNLWKKERNLAPVAFKSVDSPKTRKVYNTVKRQVFDYLRNHPNTSLRKLKSAFPATKESSIEKLYEQWDRNNTISQPFEDFSGQLSNSSMSMDDVIKAMRHTINSQNNTIEALKSQNSMLKTRQEFAFPEMEGLAKEDVKRVEKVIRTYIKGVKFS